VRDTARAPLGAAFDRFDLREPWPLEGLLNALLDRHAAVLTQWHTRLGTQEVERVRLLAETPGCAAQRIEW